jgi:hypothetical protein
MPLTELTDLCNAAIPAPAAPGQRQSAFRMPAFAAAVARLADFDHLLPGLIDIGYRLSAPTYRHHFQGILRTSFFIEQVVLPEATTTRYRTRWQLDPHDPRYAPPEQCLDVARWLINLLEPMTVDVAGATILDSIAQHPKVEHELPVTYSDRRSPIHVAENFELIDEEILRHVTGCRLLLLAAGTPKVALLRAAYDKMEVKTYKTDRMKIGPMIARTNREKRWEAHPENVQFAQRSTCMHIERVLVNQLCHFDKFPEDVRFLLEREDLLNSMKTPARCPVTRLPMSFVEFEEAITDPEHGRSAFQVGHLDPLKLEGSAWTNGHRPNNISWISEDGNRIQGSLSLDQTQEMLQRIWRAYSEAGLL